MTIPLQVRLDTPVEVEYYRNGGILHTVLRNMAKDENDPYEQRIWTSTFLFRSSDGQAEINFEGDADFISGVVNDLGLQNSGWLLPLAIKSRLYSSSQLGEWRARNP